MTEVTNAPISTEATAAPVTATETVTPTAAATPTQAATAVATSWMDNLTEEYKGNKAFANFKDLNDLAKSYIHQSALLGKKVNDWELTDVEGFSTKMGKPAKAEDYIVPVELGAEQTKWIKETAFKAGLTKDQTKALVDEIIMDQRATAAAEAKAKQAEVSTWIQDLRAEFGPAFDKRVALAQRAVDKLGGEELKTILRDTGLGNNPVIVKMFANIGKQYLEEGSVVTADKEATFGLTPQDAKRQVDMNLSNNDFRSAYFSAVHPGHKLAVEEMNRLYGIMGKK